MGCAASVATATPVVDSPCASRVGLDPELFYVGNIGCPMKDFSDYTTITKPETEHSDDSSQEEAAGPIPATEISDDLSQEEEAGPILATEISDDSYQGEAPGRWASSATEPAPRTLASSRREPSEEVIRPCITAVLLAPLPHCTRRRISCPAVDAVYRDGDDSLQASCASASVTAVKSEMAALSYSRRKSAPAVLTCSALFSRRMQSKKLSIRRQLTPVKIVILDEIEIAVSTFPLNARLRTQTPTAPRHAGRKRTWA